MAIQKPSQQGNQARGRINDNQVAVNLREDITNRRTKENKNGYNPYDRSKADYPLGINFF